MVDGSKKDNGEAAGTLVEYKGRVRVIVNKRHEIRAEGLHELHEIRAEGLHELQGIRVEGMKRKESG